MPCECGMNSQIPSWIPGPSILCILPPTGSTSCKPGGTQNPETYPALPGLAQHRCTSMLNLQEVVSGPLRVLDDYVDYTFEKEVQVWPQEIVQGIAHLLCILALTGFDI